MKRTNRYRRGRFTGLKGKKTSVETIAKRIEKKRKGA